MTITISSKNKEKTFNEKEIINIGSNQSCDYVVDIGEDFMLTVQYSAENGGCSLLNNFQCKKILFKGQPIGQKFEFEKVCKLMIEGSDEFISIKVFETPKIEKTAAKIASEDFTETDLKGLYGSDVNAITRVKLEKRKADLEKLRVAIVKQVSFAISDLKKQLSLNFNASLFVHIAMYLSSLVLAFGVSNYLMGLSIEETSNFLHLPTNIKVLLLFSIIIYGACLVLKQGVFLYLKKTEKVSSVEKNFAVNFMLSGGLLFFVCFYVINLVYYSQINIVFAVFMSLFFCALTVVFAFSSAYFKKTGRNLSVMLDKYEYREDFEYVMNEYRLWIERYINTVSNTKLRNLKDKLFNLQIKSIGEIFLGILTAPFLAYGVSNTLAMCFPEAAGWVRISGLRFSPVFLVLATFLIIFAFFAFVNAFYCVRKIQASNVIKQDGFSNFMTHCVNIFGIEEIRKLESEKTRSLIIGIIIVCIEFSMNTSYFMTEIGGDFSGIFLSIVAALVPTALLIAETYMLSQTKFDIYASDEFIGKVDRD